MVDLANPSQFKAGDHLKVRRLYKGVIPYAHHGVYEGDGMVIDFGGDAIDRVKRTSLEFFQRTSPRVEVVSHGRYTLTTGYLPAAGSRNEILARARCLIGYRPLPQPYNLVGFNCEHIANWCVAGGYCESHQTRHVFALKARVGLLGYYYVAFKTRRGSNLSSAALPVAILWFAASVLLRCTYEREIKRFYEWAEPAWRAYVASTEPLP
jgi:hypothetical protein